MQIGGTSFPARRNRHCKGSGVGGRMVDIPEGKQGTSCVQSGVGKGESGDQGGLSVGPCKPQRRLSLILAEMAP